jgi:hypothetical protein
MLHRYSRLMTAWVMLDRKRLVSVWWRVFVT